MRKVFERTYEGFESLSDLERDMYEAFDPVYNPNVVGLNSEFAGEVKITIEISEDCFE